MARSKGTKQPRAVTPLVVGKEQPKLYKASLLAEQQKFGSRERDQAIQRWLPFMEMEIQRDGEIIVSGLDFNESQAKALHAIQQLLDKTEYEGNLPGGEALDAGQAVGGKDAGFRYTGKTPRQFIKFTEYFEAYGLARKGDGSFYGHQAQEALEALRSLEEPRYICYERPKWKDNERVYDLIRTKRPVIKIVEGFHDLTEEERAEVEAGGDVPDKRARGFVVEASPLLMDGISNFNFYVLKPPTLFKEIQQLHPGKRPSRKESLFIEWLITKDRAEVKVGLDTLAVRLRLDKYIQQRKRARAAEIIQECMETAKQLHYLTDFQEKGGIYQLTLNPERCKRIKDAKPGQDDGEEP